MTLLLVIGFGLQVWLSQVPNWPWFYTSLTGFIMSLIFLALVLGNEFNWWEIDKQFLDGLAVFWIVFVILSMAGAGWYLRAMQ